LKRRHGGLDCEGLASNCSDRERLHWRGDFSYSCSYSYSGLVLVLRCSISEYEYDFADGARLHPLHDMNSQQRQTQFNRSGREITQCEAAVLERLWLGFQHRALVEEAGVVTGQIVKVRR
jgi:hypothetical protein